MEFLTVKEFNSSPRKTREVLRKNGKIVLTNNGKPSMLVFDIIGQDFESVLETLHRAEAMQLLESIQLQAARTHIDTMSLDEINTEITAYREEKNV
ncbi:MAG: hypothetical protein Ta2A_14770 [Treponemataceae bacterium]|nr:MAG: hypothetical protein Ta2A_14770 [Treponemataceae bacterium]